MRKGKFLYGFLIIQLSNLFHLQAQNNCENYLNDALCGKHYLYVERVQTTTSMNVAQDIVFQIELKEFDLPGTENSIHLANEHLSNQDYFKLVGSVDLDDNITTAIWDVYEVKSGYTGGFSKEYYKIDVSPNTPLQWYPPHLFYLGGVTRVCGPCPSCLHPNQIKELNNYVYNNFLSLLIYNQITPSTITNVGYGQNIMMKNILTPYYLSIDEYDYFVEHEGTEIYCDFGTPAINYCACYSRIFSLCGSIQSYLNQNSVSSEIFEGLVYDLISSSDCSCLNDYCKFSHKTNSTEYNLQLVSSSNIYLPEISILFKKVNSIFEFSIAVNHSHDYNYWADPALWNANSPVPLQTISYSSGSFTATSPFEIITQEQLDEDCKLDCENCLSSFSPTAGEKYIVSAWVRNNQFVGNEKVEDAEIWLDFQAFGSTSSTSIGPFIPAGSLIDGWQRIYSQFTVPSTSGKITIRLKSSGNKDVYFDDIRIFPTDGSMKSYVYDPISLKLLAELDEQNYASFYEYDEEGNLVRVKKETERGVMTIKEVRSNLSKRQ